jgi:hypothetical protein
MISSYIAMGGTLGRMSAACSYLETGFILVRFLDYSSTVMKNEAMSCWKLQEEGKGKSRTFSCDVCMHSGR